MNQLRHSLANFVKEKRGNENLRDCARRWGMSKDTISRIEKEQQNVTIDTLEHLCKVFNCEITDLFPPP